MRVEKDFKEFIALLNRSEVRYLVIDGFAFSFYAEPRFTKDIDILIESTHGNAKKLLEAIKEFGFTDVDLSDNDFLEPGHIIQLGVAPLRIDIVTSIKGVEFSAAWKDRVTGRFGDIDAHFISKDDLIKNKRALGRKQDLADIEKLEKI